MAINDSGHRPHGTHFGETPQFAITDGPESIRVTLDTWGPQDNLFPTMYDMLQANWGDAPSRRVSEFRNGPADDGWSHELQHRTGWTLLTIPERAYIDKAFAGGTLPQVLEMLTFSFAIDGVTRAFTHQNVRTRIGAGFMQHGGRDNDWRHRHWTMPETIRRACIEMDQVPHSKGYEKHKDGKRHCLTSRIPLKMLLEEDASDHGYREADANLRDVIGAYLQEGKRLYAALVDAGIPYQDARRVLPIGTQTYIHDYYTYPALKGVLANRLEHIMDWEHNCVAQLMLREVKMKCPPVISKYLGSHSDLRKQAAFAGLDSWPPDGKYPVDYPCQCGHAKANHRVLDGCEGCHRDGLSNLCDGYRPNPPKTFHRAEQNPFWVLSPAAMDGGPVEWIWTNGTYPHDRMK